MALSVQRPVCCSLPREPSRPDRTPAQLKPHASILCNTPGEHLREAQMGRCNGLLSDCPRMVRSVRPTGGIAGRRDGNARTACHLPRLRFLRRDLHPARNDVLGPRPRPRGCRRPRPRDPGEHRCRRPGADVQPHRPGSVPGDGLLDGLHDERGRNGGRSAGGIPPHARSGPRAVPDADAHA